MLALTAAVLMLTALAGCSQGAPKTAALTGYLRASGGPAPGTAYPVPGTITAENTNGTFPATVASDGTYDLSLPPGTYTVTGKSPNVLSNNTPAPCYPIGGGKVTVYANQTTTIDVYCALK